MSDTSESDIKRQVDGKFGKGNCANPGGRPKIPQEVKDMARAACPEALRTAISIMGDPEEQARDRLKAAEIILDRGYGKAIQAVDFSAQEGTKVDFSFVAPLKRSE